jgi:hypothetical protein
LYNSYNLDNRYDCDNKSNCDSFSTSFVGSFASVDKYIFITLLLSWLPDFVQNNPE